MGNIHLTADGRKPWHWLRAEEKQAILSAARAGYRRWTALAREYGVSPITIARLIKREAPELIRRKRSEWLPPSMVERARQLARQQPKPDSRSQGH